MRRRRAGWRACSRCCTAQDYAAAGGRGIGHFAVPADAHDVKKPFTHEWSGPPPFETRQLPLASGKVRFVGEPVAMVVAESAALAREAAERVAVEYDALPAVVDVRDAIAPGAPLAARRGVAQSRDRPRDRRSRPRSRPRLPQAHLVVAHRFRSQRIVNAQMEPRAAIGLL